MAAIAPLTGPTLSTPPVQKLAASSSFIAAFEYDAANLTLTTFLKSGAIYQHKFVLPSEWDALQTAQNHGGHWARQIQGKKQSVRVRVRKAPLADTTKGRKSR